MSKFDKLTEAYMKVIENTNSEQADLNIEVINFKGVDKNNTFRYYTVKINGKKCYVKNAYNNDPGYLQIFLQSGDIKYGLSLGPAQYKDVFGHYSNYVNNSVVHALKQYDLNQDIKSGKYRD
jgi:hypothetical protein